MDKYGTKLGFTIAVAVWIIAGIFHAFAGSVFRFRIVLLTDGIAIDSIGKKYL